VRIVRVTFAGLVPGVTVDGLKVAWVRLGRPTTLNVMGLLKALLSGATVNV